MILYRQLSQPEGGDSAFWDYVSQCILRGQVPYRDVVEIKTPGSAYLSAIADVDRNQAWTPGLDGSAIDADGARGPAINLIHIWRVIWRVMGVKVILVVLGLAGFLMFVVERAGAKLKRREALRSPEVFKDALIIATAVYLIFCLVDFQAGPDLIPLFPFIGIFGGWFIVKTGRSIRRSQVLNQKALFKRMTAIARELVIAIVLVITLICAASHKAQGVILEEQYGKYKTLSDMLASGDKIYAAGAVEVLVLLKRPNLNPYIMWDKGKDTYVAAEKYGGSFKAIIDEIESQRPRLVAISRLKGVSLRAELERWVAEHYDKLEGYNDSVYLRRPSTSSAPVVAREDLDRLSSQTRPSARARRTVRASA